MTCQRGQELLIDLLYGELAEPLRSELQAHLAGCAACAEEYARLRRGRAAVQRLGAEEPPLRLPRLALVGGAAARRTHPWRRWLWVAAAAAAVLAVALLLEHTTQVVAQNLPIEIKRTGVSLTILSRPPEWDRYGDAVGDRQAIVTQQKALMPADQTALQAGMLDPYRGWPGLALVRDQRLMRHVPAGAAEVRFAEVPAGIWPDSVRLRTPDGAASLTIREQNYQYDLASADAVLSKHIDHPIAVRFKGGQEVRGTLLSHDGATLVVRLEGEGRSIARHEVAAMAFEKLPQGLLTTPTLVWQLNSQARAAERQFEVDYLTTGLSWRADYVIKLRPAQKAEGKGEIIDRADLIGYATVVNNSGVTYEDAQLKLMAGDVNLLLQPTPLFRDYYALGLEPSRPGDVSGPQMVEKSFFEYHLYTLTRPTTLANHETKQLEMVSGQNLGLRRGYVFDPTANPSAALVVSEMENSEANGLGKPLPKGIVRLYAPDPEGVSTYVAQTQIDHTPVKEKLRLPWGHAFDLVGEWREMATQHNGAEHRITSECALRNHKDYNVTITVLVHVPASTYAAQCDQPWHVREVGLVEVPVVVPSGGEVKFTFQHSFNDAKGGGLRSPQPTSQGVKP